LGDALGSEEVVAKLPQVHGMPGLRVYSTVIGRPRGVEVFRLVLAVLPAPAAEVVVVSCSSRRERAG
jgi:hypothetical protein